MNHRPIAVLIRAVLILTAVGCFVAASHAQPQPQPQTAPATLQDAIKARTEVVALRQEIAAADMRQLLGEDKASKAAKGMLKVFAKAESKQEEGNILLTKDRYGEAVESYAEAAKLYRKALDWRKIQKALAKAESSAAAAQLQAEASGTAKPEQLAAAKTLQINAEGYLEAGEIDQAIAEYDKACQAFSALIPNAGPATLENAITARTAMQAARDQIKDRARFAAARPSRDDAEARQPKAGSMTDLVTRGQKAESAATDALEERQYTPARALFGAAEKLYRAAGVLQGKRDAVAASRASVEDTMKLADKAFKSEARPASFERGKQALADADKALAEDDLDAAKPLLTDAAAQFAASRSEADKMNALTEAQQAWAAALAAADEALLSKHAAAQLQAAKAKAADAQTQANAALFKEASAALAEAVAAAKTKENAAQAAPVIARLETALAGKDKFAAEDVLAELEKLIPADARMGALRDKVAALPGPQKKISADLGGGVTMPLLLIRPGSFQMGSNDGNPDEKPVHTVTLDHFWLGETEVTQAQYEAIMGKNPSQFKGADKPVENVSWNDAMEFCKKLSEKIGKTYTLPTEAQWEYACRAGSSGKYCFGDSESQLGDYAWYSGNSNQQTQPVKQKKPNAWGLYDMHGNVWEWCADWYKDSYDSGNQHNPQGPSSGQYRVLRGGSWNLNATNCRASDRYRAVPTDAYDHHGFRVVVGAGGLK
ncbi:MAG: formylglycine-generating enzyme family protein [Candidatus Sumerlaeota bacterium]|nr:formylglycine-generating enzyme family protein [Candidatus Sumerlaeota bacterium]